MGRRQAAEQRRTACRLRKADQANGGAGTLNELQRAGDETGTREYPACAGQHADGSVRKSSPRGASSLHATRCAKWDDLANSEAAPGVFERRVPVGQRPAETGATHRGDSIRAW